MKFLKNLLDNQKKHFTEGKLKKFYYAFDAIETILFTTGKVTKRDSHVRDFLDLKRTMILVVVALFPAVLMALYNTGLQANLAIAKLAEFVPATWQQSLLQTLGVSFNPESIFANMVHGALYFFPVYMVTLAVGGFWEMVFATVRKHEVAEGFLVTSLLFPLIMPPNIPYWQVALGISFGVVIGKEIFGGVGMNVFNPALLGRAFLFFAYPAEISGDKVWVAVDGISKATPLAQFADTSMALTTSWWDSFVGLIPGSMGETSALACIIGAAVLIITGIGSWRIMLGVLVGMVSLSLLFNFIGSDTNPMFAVDPLWHFTLGGFAFGMVFMATDPVSGSYTDGGKLIYGLLIGLLVVLIRVLNPAFPEGMMLAILFGNAFAPIIDKYYINKNVKRRLVRDAR
ncbi:MAG: NADH:ubiquinone reductase (Na(+)-transporting) subunit B [Rhodothermaceae bacterium]